jgi:hypothetical protein
VLAAADIVGVAHGVDDRVGILSVGNWRDPEGERSEKSKSKSKSRAAGARMRLGVHFLGREGVQ